MLNSARALGTTLRTALPARGPHVLLIDLAMPGEDGFEALRRARSIDSPAATTAHPGDRADRFTQIERER